MTEILELELRDNHSRMMKMHESENVDPRLGNVSGADSNAV